MCRVQHYTKRVQACYDIPAESGYSRARKAIDPRAPPVVVLHGGVRGTNAMREQAVHRSKVHGVRVPRKVHDHAHTVVVGTGIKVATPFHEACVRTAAHRVHHMVDAVQLMVEHPVIRTSQVVCPRTGLEVAAESDRGRQCVHTGSLQLVRSI